MAEMEKKHIVLGITGGIAAYKSAMLCSMLVQNGYEVKVVMTENSQEFVTPLTFKTLSRNDVMTSLWNQEVWRPGHVAWADWADLLLIVPATANIIGKIANGIADDALSTLAICMDADKIMIVPAMNPAMWNNVFVQKNVDFASCVCYHYVNKLFLEVVIYVLQKLWCRNQQQSGYLR